MEVLKRNGCKEAVKLDKIAARIKKQTWGLNTQFVDYMEIVQKTISGLHDGISTTELDNLAAETAASLSSSHPDHSFLASRIAITRLYKSMEKPFSKNAKRLYEAECLSEDLYNVVKSNYQKINSMIVGDRDFNIDYFGFKTLERSYLLKIDGEVSETPQYLYMRVALALWGDDFDNVQKTYDMLSEGFFTHATPTLFNAGTNRSQLASCFLIGNKGDSIDGLFDTIKDVAHISKWAGGVGLHVHNVRANGSPIKGTGGKSDGLLPMMKTYNEIARWINQGGKRKGSFAIYLEPWHADVYEFIELRKNHGKEEMRARDLFLALWVPDLFMRRVENDEDWTLFCPNDAPGLADTYDGFGGNNGEDKRFTDLYEKYEKEGKGRKVVKARQLWGEILTAQIETGTPYILFKDACNNKSNQKNIGTIKSSNLCTEIIEYSDHKEQAVCNLASVAVNKFVEIPTGQVRSQDKSKRTYDLDALEECVHQVTHNLNRVIDINFYPTKETKLSNLKHRPIGIGIQGLADTFALLGYAFDSPEARELNQEIFAAIYHGALRASVEIAKKEGAYESFKGSPISKGLLQFDLWGASPSKKWKWEKLKKLIKKHGVRNSLLLAPMPTASTAQILGNNECFEPFTSNLYKRNTLGGEFVVVNKHLVQDLINRDLWNERMMLKMFEENGSIQNIEGIPQDIKAIYKTVWEIPQRSVIDMAADRAIYICQSQSMNLFMADVNPSKLNSALFYGWKKGLKTGMYYLRTLPKAFALKGLGIQSEPEAVTQTEACSIEKPENCDSCGS
ncbi:MAG TPA: ribonucleoside-diphosphate reductase subunit alpha [Nitrospinaceae bacterium]|nr:ribonucleoside-diphosphate reductase subunit alpha [Nitrospinaceae bacterium]